MTTVTAGRGKASSGVGERIFRVGCVVAVVASETIVESIVESEEFVGSVGSVVNSIAFEDSSVKFPGREASGETSIVPGSTGCSVAEASVIASGLLDSGLA